MTLGKFSLSRVVDGFLRAVRGSTSILGAMPLAALGAWCVRIPGMRPHAPKRNVIVGLVYLYAATILLAVGTI